MWYLPILACCYVWSPFVVDTDDQYSLTIYLGTPPQPLSVSLDFGTADLLVVPNRCTNHYCKGLEDGAAFNLSYSGTLNLNKTFFTTEFLSGASVSGFWATDFLQLGGYQLNNSIFAIRSDTNNQFYTSSNLTTSLKVRSTFGIGPRGLQSSVMWSQNGYLRPVYDNFLYRLENITRTFSIYVDPVSKLHGLIIFGGMDPSFYQPQTYVTQSIFKLKDKLGSVLKEPTFLAIEFNSIEMLYLQSGAVSSISTASVSNVTGFALLDSQSGMRMTASMLHQIAQALDASYSYYADAYVVLCRASAVFYMTLPNEYVLEFPLIDYLVPLNATDAAGNDICTINIQVGDTPVLPNTMLKYYFVSVDYDNSLISFARPAYAPGSPQNVRPVSSQAYASASSSFSLISSNMPSPTFNTQLSSKYQLTSAIELTAVATSYDT